MPRKKGDPLGVDFAALNTLGLVHRLRSFTAAAEHLNVNQSAISYTVDKLRAVFHDPLFVREGGRQVSTERCDLVVLTTGQMLDDLVELSRPDGFVPAEADTSVTIACNYYERVLIVPALISAIRREAPKLRIEVINAGAEGHLRLLEGAADLLVGPFHRQEAGFYARTLIRDDYVCVMDPGHPMAGRTLSLEQYLSLDLVEITYGGQWRSTYLEALDEMGHRLAHTISVPSPAGIAQLVRGSLLVATLPRRLAEQVGEQLHLADFPAAADLEISLVWSARTHRAAMQSWLRDRIAASVRHLS